MTTIRIYVQCIIAKFSSLPSVDSSNIDTLYQTHHSWLVRLLVNKLHCPFDAADIAQDAFVRLLKQPKAFASEQEAKGYLGKIGKGLSIDLWRRKQIEQAWIDSLANQPECYYPSAEQQTIIIQALTEVDAMLRRLPDKVANAFIQTMVYGKTAKEIAQQLQVSDRTVRSYLSQAMLACISLQARQQAH